MAGHLDASDCPPWLAQMEERLRGKVRPPEAAWAPAWAAFVDGEYAAQLRMDLEDRADAEHDDPEAEAVATLRRWTRAGQRRREEPGANTVHPSRGEGAADLVLDALLWHEDARSLVLADAAEDDDDVEAFRAEHLPDGLLGSDWQLERWLNARVTVLAEEEELRRLQTRRYRRKPSTPRPKRQGPTERERELQRYLNMQRHPEVAYLRRGRRASVATYGAGELVEVAGASQRIADRYGWSPAAATTFLFLGGVPVAPMLSAATTAHQTYKAPEVTLSVHPDVPPEEVAKLYARARGHFTGQRPRLVSERVARAVVARFETPGTWATRNRALAEPYPTGDDLRRTVKRAEARLAD